MPIEKAPLQINFARGLDQKTDPLQVQPGRFLGLKNRVFNKMGRLEKRNGYGAKGQTVVTPGPSYTNSQIPGSVAAGRLVSTYQNELVESDGLNFYSYSAGNNNWVYKGRLELCQTSETSIYKNQYNNIAADSALNSTLGLNAYAWESWTADPNQGGTLRGVQISIVDSTSGLSVYNGYLVSTSSRPKCVSIGSLLYIFYFNSADGKLYAQPVTQSGFGVAVAIITNIDTTNPNYDVLVNNSLIYVAYNGTGSTVKVNSFNSALASQATVSKAETAPNGIGIFSDTSNNVWIAYNNGSATKAFIMNSTLVTTVLAATVVDNGGKAANVKNVTGIYDGTKGVIFYDQPGLPILGQQDTTTFADFTQPAVGSTVTVLVNGSTQNNTIVYIATGGYYYVSGALLGTRAYTAQNLGFTGNAAPAATILATSAVSATAGFQNSIVNYNTLTVGGSAGTAANFIRSVSLASKAFLVNGVAHVALAFDSPLQSTYFLGALYNTLSPVPNAAIVAKIAESAGGGALYRSILPSVNTVSTGVLEMAQLERTFEIQRTYANVPQPLYFRGVISSQIDFTTNEIQTNDLGKNLQIGSGVLTMYDGASVVEQSFHLYPETIVAVNAGLGTGSMSVGTYGYQVVYSWVDNQGQTHRSAPSPIVSVASASTGDSTTLTIPTLRLTEKQGATIEIYRTLANGTVYYRVDTMSSSYPLLNSVSSDTVSFVDNAGDSDISGNQQLYTGLEVENIAPPATLAMAEYKNRVILIPSDNPYSWWYSKQVIAGSPVEFSDLFVQNMGTTGGPLVGAAKLDDKLILFKGSSIYYVTGTGPSANGANNDFSDPQFITADAGLLSPRSIVTTPVGLMFKTSKGIYLLDRGLQTRYIGKAVEDYNSATVRGAELIPKSNQVRFILSNATCLMYDYFWTDEEGIGQWTVFDPVDAVSDCLFQSLHTYVTSAGLVYQETPATYLDGGSGISTYFKTGWFNLAGLQGFERAYHFFLLGQYVSAHTLTLNIYYDYDATTVAQTITITPSATELEQWRIFLNKQKCESFQIELTESGATGAGLTLSGLDILIGVKKGYPKLKAANSAS